MSGSSTPQGEVCREMQGREEGTRKIKEEGKKGRKKKKKEREEEEKGEGDHQCVIRKGLSEPWTN